MFGDIGSGLATKKSKNLKHLLLGFCVCIITTLLIFLACLFSYNMAVTLFGAFILGLFISSFHPLCNMLLIKISRPVSEIYSFGFGQMLNSVQILVNGLIFAQIYNGSQTLWTPLTFSYIALTYLIAFICFCGLNLEENPTSEADKKTEEGVLEKKLEEGGIEKSKENAKDE